MARGLGRDALHLGEHWTCYTCPGCGRCTCYHLYDCEVKRKERKVLEMTSAMQKAVHKGRAEPDGQADDDETPDEFECMLTRERVNEIFPQKAKQDGDSQDHLEELGNVVDPNEVCSKCKRPPHIISGDPIAETKPNSFSKSDVETCQDKNEQTSLRDRRKPVASPWRRDRERAKARGSLRNAR